MMQLLSMFNEHAFVFDMREMFVLGGILIRHFLFWEETTFSTPRRNCFADS